MSTGSRFINPAPQFRDYEDDSAVGGQLFFYASGTTTPQATYSDSAMTVPNQNPVILDAYGRPSVNVFLDPSFAYRCVLKDADEAVIWDKDILAGGDIAASIAAHNADPAAHYPASETQRGFVELANQTEANALTDAARALTPGTLGNFLRSGPGVPANVINGTTTVTIASAATIDLDTALSNVIDVSGNVGITAVTLGNGRVRLVRFTGTPTLTNSGNLVLPGSANIVVAPGDHAIFVGAAGSITRLEHYTRASGNPLTGPTPIVSPGGLLNTGGDTGISIPAGAWKKLDLVLSGVKSASNFLAWLRLNGDTGANYSYGQWQTTATGEANYSQFGTTGISLTDRTSLIPLSGAGQFPLDVVIELIAPTRNDPKGGFIRSVSPTAASIRTIHGSLQWTGTAPITTAQILLRDTPGTSPTGATVNASAGSYYFVGEL